MTSFIFITEPRFIPQAMDMTFRLDANYEPLVLNHEAGTAGMHLLSPSVFALVLAISFSRAARSHLHNSLLPSYRFRACVQSTVSMFISQSASSHDNNGTGHTAPPVAPLPTLSRKTCRFSRSPTGLKENKRASIPQTLWCACSPTVHRHLMKCYGWTLSRRQLRFAMCILASSMFKQPQKVV